MALRAIATAGFKGCCEMRSRQRAVANAAVQSKVRIARIIAGAIIGNLVFCFESLCVQYCLRGLDIEGDDHALSCTKESLREIIFGIEIRIGCFSIDFVKFVQISFGFLGRSFPNSLFWHTGWPERLRLYCFSILRWP